MTSDDKRREVAARMRACARDVSGTLDFAMYLSNWVGIEGVTDDGGNHFSGAADRRCAERTLEKLADLIDRPTCHDVGGGYEFRCSGCGCAIHIYRDGGFGEDDSAMTVGGDSLYVPHYCPNCGAEVA